MSDQLYAQYIAEREGLRGIWKEWGFVTYKIANGECYLADMYVHPEKRRAGSTMQLLRELFDIARAGGCDIVTAHIHMNDPNNTKTLRAALACGFEPVAAANGTIVIAHKLEGK
jgi:GNAT superfamily N-acetyltransferase